MCGIVGYIDLLTRSNENTLKNNVKNMLKSINHRGPDDRGTWCDEENGLALGQARLAIIDLSETGKQPMISHNQRYVMVFNGEIYNYLDMKQELLEKTGNIVFRGTSDSEVLLEYISNYGLEEALKSSNGMFAIALWDKKERTISFARDRFGQKPLYYGWDKNRLVFASELKAIMSLKNFEKNVNKSSLSLYLRHANVPAPYSIFEGIYKLCSGSYIIIDCKKSGTISHPNEFSPYANVDDKLSPKTYWSARDIYENSDKGILESGDEKIISSFDALLTKAVERCMVSDVPLGAFLSGGIDSSLIVSIMQKISSRAVKTFSIGFEEKGFNEAVYAKEVAKHLKTDHSELYLSQKDALDIVPQLPQMYDEPFADSSQIPTYLVSKMAKEYVTVSLSGDGGDELFGGYNRYLWASKVNKFINSSCGTSKVFGKFIKAFPPSFIDMVANVTPKFKNYNQFGDKLHKLASLLEAKNEKDLYLKLVSFWDMPEKVLLNANEPKTIVNDEKKWVKNSQNDLSKDEKYISDMMMVDALTYMSDDILTKVDRAAMAVSLETRVPLLDHEVFEFSQKLPFEYKIRNSSSKWIMRNTLYNYVPKQMVEREKMGFGVPINFWLKKELKDWACDLLSKESLEKTGVFNIKEINKTWKDHISGRRNYQHKLWAILMYQAWHKEYI